jgi:hypothetical protein
MQHTLHGLESVSLPRQANVILLFALQFYVDRIRTDDDLFNVPFNRLTI